MSVYGTERYATKRSKTDAERNEDAVQTVRYETQTVTFLWLVLYMYDTVHSKNHVKYGRVEAESIPGLNQNSYTVTIYQG